MLDYLLRFHGEHQAKKIIPAYWLTDAGTWDDRCIPDASVYKITGTETVSDPAGDYEQETREPFPGWFIVIALPGPEIDTTLTELPDNACRLVTDRDAAAAAEPSFVLYMAPDMDAEDLVDSRVEPLFAGSEYPEDFTP